MIDLLNPKHQHLLKRAHFELKNALEDRGMFVPDKMNVIMDLETCAERGYINVDTLAEWSWNDRKNFLHDILGIYCHLDRDTGEMKRHFVPRSA